MTRSLLSAALAATMIGGVVLAPTAAFGQSRGRDDLLNKSRRSDQNRSGRQESRRDSDTSRFRRDGDQRNDDRWNRDRRDGDRSRWDRDRRGDDWRRERNREDWNRRDNDRWGRWDNDRSGHYRRPTVTYPRIDNYSYGYPRYDNYSYGYGHGYSRHNDWHGIAELAGLIAIIGVLDNDPHFYFSGSYGSLYPFDMYHRDRYSSDRACRLRASYFSQPYFYRDGRRYDREIVRRSGRDYYRFVCR